MAQTIYTNCLTITVGCFLYTNAGLTTPASNGKYSDGTTCYTVTGGSGEITSSSSCSGDNVYLNLNVNGNADSSGILSSSIQLASQSVNTYVDGSYVNVLTDVTVYFTIYGESSTISSDDTIITGFHCKTGISLGGFLTNELIDACSVTSVSPGSYSTQIYLAGFGFRDSNYGC